MNDLRELLQVGCKYTCEAGWKAEIGNEFHLSRLRKRFNSDLSPKNNNVYGITKIERPKYNGIHTIGNPQWELVWEWKEPKFYLKLKNETVAEAIGYNYLNYIAKNESYFFGCEDEHCYYKTKFTRSEIEQIPQALRNLCVEIKVED